VTATRKLAIAAALFAAALVLLAVTVATKNVAPLFALWVPLLAVPWVLVRPQPEDPSPEPPPTP
jgi:hypothetical protein